MNVDIFPKQLLEHLERIDAGASLDGSMVAALLTDLTAREVEEGGPYASVAGTRNLDIGLNVAIACVLRGLDVTLPKLDAYVETALSAGECGDVYDTGTFNVLSARFHNTYAEMKSGVNSSSVSYTAEEQKVIDRIFEKFDTRFASFAPEVVERARQVIGKTIRGNPDKQMSLMAHFTRATFGEQGADIPDDMVADMGLANIFFWTAFIIYDDFWDEDETASPKSLPIANIFARHYVNYFSNLLPEETGFRAWFHRMMDGLDGANAWETEYCRARVENGMFHIPETLPAYNDYEKKFLPAAGHLAGPIALMIMRGYKIDSREVSAFIDYFRHYLIAMQLNDDAHDFEEDLVRGHLSTVIDLLVRDWRAAHPHSSTIDLAKDLPELKELFWFKTMPHYIERALQHSEQARTALASIGVFLDKGPLMQFPEKTAATAKKAQQEYTDVDKFIALYR